MLLIPAWKLHTFTPWLSTRCLVDQKKKVTVLRLLGLFMFDVLFWMIWQRDIPGELTTIQPCTISSWVWTLLALSIRCRTYLPYGDLFYRKRIIETRVSKWCKQWKYNLQAKLSRIFRTHQLCTAWGDDVNKFLLLILLTGFDCSIYHIVGDWILR